MLEERHYMPKLLYRSTLEEWVPAEHPLVRLPAWDYRWAAVGWGLAPEPGVEAVCRLWHQWADARSLGPVPERRRFGAM